MKAQEERENVFLHPPKFYKKFFPSLKIKRAKVDTLYLKTYLNYLSASTHLVIPKINFNLNPTGIKGKEQNASSIFRTNINETIGFSGSYRYITIGFSIASKSTTENKAGYTSTKYRATSVKYNGIKYSLLFMYIKVAGLTDINRLNSTNDTYSSRRDITMKDYYFEGLYNFSWKKFAYVVPVNFTPRQRQIKSRVGFLIKGGVYNHQLYSDTNLLSVRQRPHFEEFEEIHKMIGYSIKLAPGIGGNLVVKKNLCFSLLLFAPYNLYVNRLYTADDKLEKRETVFQWLLDGMIGVVYQKNRFHAGLRYQADTRVVKLQHISLNYFQGSRLLAPPQHP